MNTTVEYHVHNSYLSMASEAKRVEVEMLLDVPSNQKIRYGPSFIEKSILFLVQYLAMLLVSLWFFYWSILGEAFKRSILPSRVVSEIMHV